jgi:hypothetical protein
MMHSVGMAWGWILPTLVVLVGGYVGWLALRRHGGAGGDGGRAESGRITEHRTEANLQARIYSLAKKRGGSLTVSDVVVETGVSPTEAERVLESMTDNMRVRMEVTDEGTVTYEFPELKETE